MPDPDFSMPVAVPPSGSDSAAFYGGFAGKLRASWTPAEGLIVWVAAEANIARLHAPVKAALRFAPAGASVGGTRIEVNTLFLQTWPTAYTALKAAIRSPVPTEIRFENPDTAAVRNAVQPLFTALGRAQPAVDAFMRGEGLLRVAAGTAIGAAAAAGAGAPSPATPNRVRILLFNSAGAALNPVQFFSDAADHARVDKVRHPLLSQLDLNGWLEVIAADASGSPLADEPYELFLGDGTTRRGRTDANGRIFEQRIPAGGWGLDLTNHPAFTLLEE